MPGGVRHVFASPATDSTHLAIPNGGHTHFVPELWSDATSALAPAPTLAATSVYATSTIPAAIPAASMVAIGGAPVLRAAMHRGQQRSRVVPRSAAHDVQPPAAHGAQLPP